VAVREQDQGLDELGQRPAVLARLQQGLDVLLGDEPRPVCQQLVDLTELAELLRGPMETKQPLWVTPVCRNSAMWEPTR